MSVTGSRVALSQPHARRRVRSSLDLADDTCSIAALGQMVHRRIGAICTDDKNHAYAHVEGTVHLFGRDVAESLDEAEDWLRG